VKEKKNQKLKVGTRFWGKEGKTRRRRGSDTRGSSLPDAVIKKVGSLGKKRLYQTDVLADPEKGKALESY